VCASNYSSITPSLSAIALSRGVGVCVVVEPWKETRSRLGYYSIWPKEAKTSWSPIISDTPKGLPRAARELEALGQGASLC
jgi:hypothetical protein